MAPTTHISACITELWQSPSQRIFLEITAVKIFHKTLTKFETEILRKYEKVQAYAPKKKGISNKNSCELSEFNLSYISRNC